VCWLLPRPRRCLSTRPLPTRHPPSPPPPTRPTSCMHACLPHCALQSCNLRADHPLASPNRVSTLYLDSACFVGLCSTHVRPTSAHPHALAGTLSRPSILLPVATRCVSKGTSSHHGANCSSTPPGYPVAVCWYRRAPLPAPPGSQRRHGRNGPQSRLLLSHASARRDLGATHIKGTPNVVAGLSHSPSRLNAAREEAEISQRPAGILFQPRRIHAASN
jgi:hypothetical protein